MTLTQWLMASIAIMPLTVGNDMLLFFREQTKKLQWSFLVVFVRVSHSTSDLYD
ncbi:hypothetical protein MU448_10115 [Streptococcus sp. O1]|nr:hypothetical protein [Streptococcus sp. O1]